MPLFVHDDVNSGTSLCVFPASFFFVMSEEEEEHQQQKKLDYYLLVSFGVQAT